ncbi:hephaestin-like isoform X2 [Mercenaria mercenaria]|uniref:hephaestin-like isoform X2 n=1 Tax=Mercenaria mercenaria TaxID=6596 RepID=UPI00234E6B9E|nr:hephaestin-like isoform X2 [Mercenaria mercenaria]
MKNYVIVFIIFVLCCGVSARIRHYYIAAVEQEWDYAPSGRDLVFNHQSEADLRIKTQKDRIGSKYVKLVYKQYTDATFSQESLKPAYQGYVGPTLKGEVGDMIYVTFRNAIKRKKINLSVHPHGLFYSKMHEGALYLDGESTTAKVDDSVPPGGSHIYAWNITENFAPTVSDDKCIPWGYHSHVDSMTDIETGLVGVLVTCKPGTLTPDGRRMDVAQEIVLYTEVTDESSSHYADVNLRRCLNPRVCRNLLRRKDERFIESNKMYHINGYVYGNLPGLEVCEGDDVAIYTFALANGIHTMQIYGQTFIVKNHRMDAVSIYPASFMTVNTVPINVGTWLLVCRNNDHLHDGMTAFFKVKQCAVDALPDTPPGKRKRYFIAAEEVNWNYMPGGKDLYTSGKIEMDHGFSSNSHHHMHHGEHHDALGNTYKKAVFVEYEDEFFRRMKPRPLDEEHLHMLGPPIKVEIGDEVEVVFMNKASRPYSFLPHGVGIDKSQEGSVYYTRNSDVPYGLITQPRQVTKYHFTVPWTAAPTADDPNCLSYTYHSAVDMRKDTNTGLVGPLLVCKPGSLDDKGKQIHVNKEIFVLFQVVDENLSWYIDESIKEFSPDKALLNKNDEAFKHGNLIHAINGRIYGTLNGIDMCLGDRVSWHFLGVGSSKDLHGIALEGNSMAVNGRTLDSKVIIPGLGFTGYMHPDNVGKWALYCHTHHHLMAGMTSMYSVNVCQGPQSLPVVPMKPSGGCRRYYIAAVEIEWNYAPSGIDKIIGKPLTDDSAKSYLFTRRDRGFMGTVYKKAVYREFTDDTFKYEKKRGYREIHLGLLGPFIRAEVGDVIEVVFMNKASHPFSIKPHGVFTNKRNEGMKYNDGLNYTEDSEVQPGKVFTYRWTVPQRAGPGPNEPNCIGWMYHSGTNMIRDTPTGLFGPLVTCRRGVLDPKNQRLDQHSREFAMAYYIINENRSWYIRENMQRVKEIAPHQKFEESNLMSSINGYILGNTPGMVMENNEHVTWYVMGFGSEDDYHTVHFHGQTYVHRTAKSHRGDVLEVFPGTYETVDMYTDNPGTWLIHCHVMEHLVHGMEAKFAVVPKGALKPLEDAERNKTLPIVLHKLPVVSQTSTAAYSSKKKAKKGPPRKATVLIIPPKVRSDLPIIANNVNQVSHPSSIQTQTGNVINARADQKGVTSGGPKNHVLANEELMGLRKNGILPGRWQILTRPNSQNRTRRKK